MFTPFHEPFIAVLLIVTMALHTSFKKWTPLNTCLHFGPLTRHSEGATMITSSYVVLNHRAINTVTLKSNQGRGQASCSVWFHMQWPTMYPEQTC